MKADGHFGGPYLATAHLVVTTPEEESMDEEPRIFAE